MNLASHNIISIQIYADGIKRQWGNQKHQVSVLSDTESSES